MIDVDVFNTTEHFCDEHTPIYIYIDTIDRCIYIYALRSSIFCSVVNSLPPPEGPAFAHSRFRPEGPVLGAKDSGHHLSRIKNR